MPKDLTHMTSIRDMNKKGDRSKTLTGSKRKRKKPRKRKAKGITKHLTGQ